MENCSTQLLYRHDQDFLFGEDWGGLCKRSLIKYIAMKYILSCLDGLGLPITGQARAHNCLPRTVRWHLTPKSTLPGRGVKQWRSIWTLEKQKGHWTNLGPCHFGQSIMCALVTFHQLSQVLVIPSFVRDQMGIISLLSCPYPPPCLGGPYTLDHLCGLERRWYLHMVSCLIFLN